VDDRQCENLRIKKNQSKQNLHDSAFFFTSKFVIFPTKICDFFFFFHTKNISLEILFDKRTKLSVDKIALFRSTFFTPRGQSCAANTSCTLGAGGGLQ